MKLIKAYLITLVLVLIGLFIHIYSNDSTRVENQYSTGVYPLIGRFLRYLFGWLPFSVGDILYGLIILWMIWKIFRSVKALINRTVTKQKLASNSGKMLRILLVTYIVFNALWGLNYNRVGIADQLNLTVEKYGLEDLSMINGLLVKKTNAAKQYLVTRAIKDPSKRVLFSKVQSAYRDAEKIYPFLKYQPGSIKPSLWSWVGNYMGFTGYYNPFTGEAQVNTLVPKFLQPFTSCHEVAHQLGYAKEREANFVGFLAAISSTDTLLHYSVYLDLFMYSNRNLFETDSLAAKEFADKLIPEVRADLIQWRAFNKKYKNPAEPLFRWIYGVYLKQNQQPQGVMSYDEVTGFMIAYYKKYGKT